ncbi:hypothetical protein [Streptomyces longispororuber]|uniref:hypothetical protein n=1 Tax=Streptomyces longispororuber TaxID=68230 RepID=UPI00210A027B|nr:hypothetical protein [Streptomyces longispororuber]MCQ4205538.1 hypothetical protein [Streptomyces longispororuber]
MMHIDDQRVSIGVQGKVCESHDHVPALRARAVPDPSHQRERVLTARGEGLAHHLYIEPPASAGLGGEPGRKNASHALRHLRRRVRIRQKSNDRNF